MQNSAFTRMTFSNFFFYRVRVSNVSFVASSGDIISWKFEVSRWRLAKKGKNYLNDILQPCNLSFYVKMQPRSLIDIRCKIIVLFQVFGKTIERKFKMTKITWATDKYGVKWTISIINWVLIANFRRLNIIRGARDWRTACQAHSMLSSLSGIPGCKTLGSQHFWTHGWLIRWFFPTFCRFYHHLRSIDASYGDFRRGYSFHWKLRSSKITLLVKTTKKMQFGGT